MARNSGSLDANVLLRLILSDIPPQYTLARQLFESAKQLVVADSAVIETIYAMNKYYLVPRPKIQKTFQNLATNQKLQINMEVFEPALKMYIQHPALSIEDCYLACLAQQQKALPLWTFDKKLASQSGGLAKELMPE